MLRGAQLPEAPAKAQVFLEDLPEEEQDVNGFAKYGAGARRRPAACCAPFSESEPVTSLPSALAKARHPGLSWALSRLAQSAVWP